MKTTVKPFNIAPRQVTHAANWGDDNILNTLLRPILVQVCKKQKVQNAILVALGSILFNIENFLVDWDGRLANQLAQLVSSHGRVEAFGIELLGSGKGNHQSVPDFGSLFWLEHV